MTMPMIWDMETSDPDDFFTLLLLLGHPEVDLKAVTITPGTPAQVGLVRRAVVDWFGRDDVRIGAGNLDHDKQCVSAFHERAFGTIVESRQAEDAAELLAELCDATMTMVTGAALKNLGRALSLRPDLALREIVIQGGFAGEGVVAPADQLEKFRGRVTCPSFNLNGDPATALAVQQVPTIARRRFVSKNVCHGVAYDRAMHDIVATKRALSPSLDYIWRGMEVYLAKRPGGKLFHDPLAACCAIAPEIGTWAEVELYRERGEWGSRLHPTSATWIITRYDHARFLEVLLSHEAPS